MSDFIYLGIKGSVVAMDRLTGQKVWQTKLKGSGFVTIALDRELVLAHTKGSLYALNAETGEIQWNNGLLGLGYGYVTVAGAGISPEQGVAAIQQMIAEQSAAGAG